MEELLKAIASFGVSAKEAEETLNTLNELMQYIGAQSKINEYDKTFNNIRSALNTKTENPNQKDDLENFSQIEVNPFLPGFVDLDSEEYIHQRPI